MTCKDPESAKEWLAAVNEALEWRERTRSASSQHHSEDPELMHFHVMNGCNFTCRFILLPLAFGLH
jgi:hypothetical protein